MHVLRLEALNSDLDSLLVPLHRVQLLAQLCQTLLNHALQASNAQTIIKAGLTDVIIVAAALPQTSSEDG